MKRGMNTGMKQVLAIFRKDARHLWPEICISLALQAALVALYPRQWRHAGLGAVSYSFGAFATSPDAFGDLLNILIPISWWVLLARLVHEERLVGHTQFWITRPYRWPLLLAAKLLFASAFVYLPFLIVQCILLHAAGFQPLAHVPGLLFNALLLTGIVILPLAAVASVTSNLARMTLVLLGVLVFVAGLATLAGVLPRLASSPSLVSSAISFMVLLCGAATILVIQYARRRARTAWVLLAVVALLLGSSGFYDADQPFMNRFYPPAGASAAPSVEFSYSENPMMRPVAHGSGARGMIEIAIPVHVAGIAPHTVVIPTAIKVTLDSEGSSHWDSPWQTLSTDKFLSAPYDAVFRFRMRRETYEQFRNGPVSLHMTVAIDQGRTIRENTIALPDARFEVPGFGMCTPQGGWDGEPVTIGISCLSAVRQPDLTFVTVLWHDDCRAPNDAPPPAVSGYGWVGSLDAPAAEPSLTAVLQAPMALTNSWRYSNRTDEQRIHMRELCPGIPVTFTSYALQTRTRAELSIAGFRLPELSKATAAEYRTQ